MKLTQDDIVARMTRDWVRLSVIAWLGIAAYFIWAKWPAIHWLALGDTDDNMRLMQVRALLNGQGWFDLRQYRLNPPGGFDIHWSRIVDLPIAGLILLFKPFVGTAQAERLACGIAPLLPLLAVMIAIGFTVRRLVDPRAWPIAIVILVGSAAATLGMFMPMRIDHHGWQLACLAATVAGMVDPRRARGGAIVGLSSAISLAIGLELLPYVLMAGAILTLRWVWDAEGDGREARRLMAYGVALSGGVAAGYAGFASYANRVPRCDALTPVYLTAMVAAGAALFGLAAVNPRRRGVRFGLAIAAGAALAAGFAWLFPQCLSGRPEQVSPELAANWLNNVREAKPIYLHDSRMILSIVTLPVMGLIGAVLGHARARGTDRPPLWAALLLFQAFGIALLFWQVRAGPAAQLLALPGTTALVWIVVPWFLNHRSMPVRVLGTAAAFVIVTGMSTGIAIKFFDVAPPSNRTKRINRTTARCMSQPSLAALDRYPPATILTFTDLGPRLIAMTHHNAIAGPYHRNGDAILDVQHAFTGTDAFVRDVARRHGATLMLLCPNMAESTVYRARKPGGFYDRMAHGARPDWLEPLPLPKGSPFRLYRLRLRAAD